ncbi:MAG TPA: YeeE/YedE thiosulfate transporter family protein [Candidatus Omnitrophota bacterium]|nr:YeeE/YedE thiosulfate transporter family protein [Candidatus Omnitrophota bacterium]HPN57198.1 YeeE/YedE thiosulfate transporter family protein [Candidatus Omnitrophota bacterium]
MLWIGFLFGIGFGFFVQRAGLCFAHGLGEIFMGKGKRIARYFLLIFVITGTGFWLSGAVSPLLGLKPVGEIRGHGFYNVLSGLIFGAGIALNGGCVLGTLRQIGEGNLSFLVVFIALIPGMALVVYGLNPLLEKGYQAQQVVLPDLLGVPGGVVMGALVLAALAGLKYIRSLKKG